MKLLLKSALFSLALVMPAIAGAATIEVRCQSSHQYGNSAKVEGAILVGALHGSEFKRQADAHANLALKLAVNGAPLFATNGVRGFPGVYRKGEGNHEDSEYHEVNLEHGDLRVEFELIGETVTIKRQGAEFFAPCEITRK